VSKLVFTLWVLFYKIVTEQPRTCSVLAVLTSEFYLVLV
jgi:hypothetical protein